MALIITGTAGLVVWIVLWGLGVSGFDGILIAILMVLIVQAVRNLVPLVMGRRESE
jgi:hypothetical protein